MITPNRVREVVEDLASREGGLDEDCSRLHVTGRLDAELIAVVRETARELAEGLDLKVSALDELGDVVDLCNLGVDRVEQRIRVTVLKASVEGAVCLLTLKGLTAFLHSTEFLHARCIRVATDFEPFQTERCHFEVWTTATVADVGPEQVAVPGPRRFVKDLTGGQVPASIEPFVLKGEPPATSSVFEEWKQVACRAMLLSLPTEVWRDGAVERVSLNGPRTRRLDSDLAASCDAKILEAATDACRWVYLSGRDTEVRHVMLAYELAREWPEDIGWRAGFALRAPRALEAAKTSFHAHVREVSKETLKSLGELRKTLSEEVTRVVTQTRDLLSTMWRDFIVAAAAILGRITLLYSDKPSADSRPALILLLGATAFLIFSLSVTLLSNARFMQIAAENRAAWRSKLYGFLPDEDLKTLSDEPLVKADRAYHLVKHLVLAAYLVVAITLLATAFNLGPSGPTVAAAGASKGTASSVAPGGTSASMPSRAVVAGSPTASGPMGASQAQPLAAPGAGSRPP